MSLVNQILKRVGTVNELLESAKTAEKARVDGIITMAANIFKETYGQFSKLQTVSNSGSVFGDSQHFELHVALAEVAFFTGNQKISRRILEQYFQLGPQSDQYNCRANLLMGLVLDFEATQTTGIESIRQRKIALAQMLKALDVALAPENTTRYKFIVYDASVQCWKVLRRFIRPTRAKHFAQEMSKISAALEKFDDPDKEWRIMYLSATAVCFEDAKDVKQSCDLIDKALEHAEKLVVGSASVETTIMATVKTASSESEELMSAIRRLEDSIFTKKNWKKKIDPDAPEEEQKMPAELPTVDCSAEEEEIAILKKKLAIAQDKKAKAEESYRANLEIKTSQQEAVIRLYRQRIHVNPADAKRVLTLPGVMITLRSKVMINLQCVASKAIEEKDWQVTFTQLMKELDAAEPSATITETQLDVCRTALQIGLKDVAAQCLAAAEAMTTTSPVVRVKLDLCKALTMVSSVDGAEESANSDVGARLTSREIEGHAVSVRIEALKLLERIITMCESRLSDSALLQEICTAVWNTAVPLLQTHLRPHVHRALQLAARALENVDAPLNLLRAQVYLELAKCEEQADFVGRARDEAVRAIETDYGVIEDVPAGGVGVGGGNAVSAQAGGKSPISNVPGTTSPGKEAKENAEVEELDRERPLDHLIRPIVETLTLRGSVYDTPEEVEPQVILLLQQIKESSSRTFQRDMLKKAAVSMMELMKQEHIAKHSSHETSDHHSGKNKSGRAAMLQRMQSEKKLVLSTLPVSEMPDMEAPSLGEIEESLQRPRAVTNITPAVPAKSGKGAAAVEVAVPGPELSSYDVFTSAKQRRVNIMSSTAQVAQMQSNFAIAQRAALQVLDPVWDPVDPLLRQLLDGQIEMHFVLANSLVERLSQLWITPESEEAMEREEIELSMAGAAGNSSSAAALAPTDEHKEGDNVPTKPGDTKKDTMVPDPRALGIASKYATEEMNTVKRLVILALTKALRLAVLVGDEVGAQNAVIYFWNLHIHIFRRELYHHASPEMFEFIQYACDAMDTLKQQAKGNGDAIKDAAKSSKGPAKGDSASASTVSSLLTTLDDRLRLSLSEAYSQLLHLKGQTPQAVEILTKACSSATAGLTDPCSVVAAAYQMRRIGELACRMTAAASAAAAAAVAAAGGKGTAKETPPPKFDNPFLSAYAALVQAEAMGANSPKEAIAASANNCVAIVEGDVAKVLKSLNWSTLNQDVFNQALEMQVELWTRLTRINVLVGSVHGAQAMAERCLNIVTDALTRPLDENALTSPRHSSNASEALEHVESNQRLSPRVWRWISLCERYFAMAIKQIIQPDGQELALQDELRLATIRHLVLSCTYGLRASASDLAVAAVAYAWNTAIPLMRDDTSAKVRNSLGQLLRQLLGSLASCGKDDSTASALKQQIYLVLIENMSKTEDWDATLSLVMEAFAKVPAELQKPLWRWRVIVMSKKGKSVLDGIQKLTAGQRDPTLQASVYAILARASAAPKQQLDAYRKALEILKDDPARVDYMLETAQWQSSSGFPKKDTMNILLATMDVFYELEESRLGVGDGDSVGDDTASKSSAASSRTGRSRGSLGNTGRSKAGGAAHKGGGSKHGGSARGGGGGGTARTGRLSSRSKQLSFRSTLDTGNDGVPKMTLRQCEQAIRTTIMLSQVESDESKRRERLLETVYFVSRYLEMWMEGVKTTEKVTLYATLGAKEREETPFYKFKPPANPVTDGLLVIPDEPTSLICWMPSPKFVEVHESTAKAPESHEDVPTRDVLPSMSLMVTQMLWACSELSKLGHAKHSLYCLGFLRALLLFVPLDGKDAALAAVHYKTVNIASSCGISDILAKMPTVLGTTKVSPGDYIATLGYKVMETLIAKSANAAVGADGATAGLMSPTAAGLAHDGYDDLRRPNDYGVSTWTQITDPNVLDTNICALGLCEDLLDLGQLSACKSVAVALGVYFAAIGDRRGRLQASALQAKALITSGLYRDALAILLSSKEDLAQVGDSTTLSQHVQLAVTCYVKMGQVDEALRIAQESIALLKGSCIQSVKLPEKEAPAANTLSRAKPLISASAAVTSSAPPSLPPTAPGTATSSAARLSNVPSATSIATSVARGTASVTSAGTSAATASPVDKSLEAARALVTVFGGFCSALTTQPVVLPAGASSSAAASRFDAAIKAVESQSSSTLESVVAVAGPSSSLAAQVMEITSQTKYTLICNAFKDGIPFVAVGANPGSASVVSTSASFGAGLPTATAVAAVTAAAVGNTDEAVANLEQSLNTLQLEQPTEPKSFQSIEALVNYLTQCLDITTKAGSIRRQLYGKLAIDDKSYIVPAEPPPPPPVDPKVKKGKEASLKGKIPKELEAPPAAPVDLPPVIKSLSAPTQRALGWAELFSALLHFQISILRGEHLVNKPTTAQYNKYLRSLAPPDRYLEETKRSPEESLDNYLAPFASRGLHLAASARDLLASSDGVNEASLLFNIGTMLLAGCDGHLQSVWRDPKDYIDESVPHKAPAPAAAVPAAVAAAPPVEHASSPSRKKSGKAVNAAGHAAHSAHAAPAPAAAAPVEPEPKETILTFVPEQVIASRAELVATLGSFVQTCSGRTLSSVSSSSLAMAALGAYTMFESFGSQESNRAACWLLMLNSIAARSWLMSLWLKALNPTCEVAAAVSRLQLAEEQLRRQEIEHTKPGTELQKQISAEMNFLYANSISWRRLDVSIDPSKIIGSLNHGIVTLCLQLCPQQKTLMVCVGNCASKPAGPASSVTGDYVNPGEWIVDKVLLTDSQRQSLYTLRAQHDAWTEETTKFIARFGDLISCDEDIEGVDSVHPDRRILKTEIALEERLRALLEDMERLVAPLLGEGSRVRSAMEKWTHASSGSSSSLASSKTLLLLLDPILQPLPWEGHSIVKTLFKDRVSRDYSIHMQGHRLAGVSPFVSIAAPPGAAGGSADHAHATHAPVALAPLGASQVRYMADPFAEDPGSSAKGYERESMAHIFGHLTGKASTEIVTSGAITPNGGAPPLASGAPTGSANAGSGNKWTKLWDSAGLIGGGVGSLSLQDWINAASSGTKAKPTSILAHMPSRMSTVLTPREALAVNFEGVGLLFAADLSQNDLSYRRQNSLDNLKRPEEIALEQPFHYAALLSLSGFSSMVVMSWSTSLAAQRRFVMSFFEAFTKKHEDVSMALATANKGAAVPQAGTLAGQPNRRSSVSRRGSKSGSNSTEPSPSKPSPSPSTTRQGPINLKRWIRLARINIGVSSLTYAENS